MKKLLLIAGIGLLALLAAAGIFVYTFDANRYRPLLEAQLTQALGRQVKVGEIRLQLLQGNVSAADVTIADDPAYSKSDFLRAGKLDVGVELKPLIFDQKLNVTGVTIDKPEIHLIQSAGGEWNFSSLSGKKAAANSDTAAPASQPGAANVRVDQLKISGGRITLDQPKMKPRIIEDVALEVRNFSITKAFPFKVEARMGGARAKLDGEAGPVDAKDASLTPVSAKVGVSNLDLAASGAVEQKSGIGGVASFNGAVAVNGRKVDVNGTLRAEKLKLARQGSPAKIPVELQFSSAHNTVKRTGTVSRAELRIGKSAVQLSGDYALRGDEPPVVGLHVDASKVAVADLVEMLPPLAITLPSGSRLEGGYAHAKLTIGGPADNLTVSGPIGLNNARLAGFDLGSKIKFAAKLAGIAVGPDTEIQQLSATVRRSPSGTDVQDIEFLSPALGEITGSGTVSPQDELDFAMVVRLKTSGAVMVALGQKGDTTIPMNIRGTASNPVFQPDVKGLAAKKAVGILESQKVGQILDKQGEAGKAVKGVIEGLFGRKKP